MPSWIESVLLAGVPALAAIVSAIVLYRSNRDAHVGIVNRIADVDRQSCERDETLSRALNGNRKALESIARDVSFMAGRQAERDNRRGASGGAGA